MNVTARTPSIIFRDNESERVLLKAAGDSLRELDLSGANLSGAAMYAIELTGGLASGSPTFDLKRRKVDLHGANLSSADLSSAVFSEEVVVGADFSKANLQQAVFVRSHFIRTNFTGANLSGARLMNTSFSDCPTLRLAVGLDTMEHRGPTALDARTLRTCVGALPDAFLLGAGYTSEEIRHLRSLYREHRQFYSCFISYARQDSDFASRLRTRLIRGDISCWQDTHDLLGGDYWRRQIDEAIEKHDKLILVCSAKSLERESVVAEILEAIERERLTKKQRLFPLRLDDYVLSDDLAALSKEKVSRGEWREDWVRYVRAYHIPDFSCWTNSRKFSAEFKKLVQALLHPAGR